MASLKADITDFSPLITATDVCFPINVWIKWKNFSDEKKNKM